MKKITVMTPCYNEEGNIEDLYLRVKEVFNQLPNYEYEHLFIDNASQDKTVDELKKINLSVLSKNINLPDFC